MTTVSSKCLPSAASTLRSRSTPMSSVTTASCVGLGTRSAAGGPMTIVMTGYVGSRWSSTRTSRSPRKPRAICSPTTSASRTWPPSTSNDDATPVAAKSSHGSALRRSDVDGVGRQRIGALRDDRLAGRRLLVELGHRHLRDAVRLGLGAVGQRFGLGLGLVLGLVLVLGTRTSGSAPSRTIPRGALRRGAPLRGGASSWRGGSCAITVASGADLDRWSPRFLDTRFFCLGDCTLVLGALVLEQAARAASSWRPRASSACAFASSSCLRSSSLPASCARARRSTCDSATFARLSRYARKPAAPNTTAKSFA